jgi:glycerophosphoryl diester phosphodiesterase
MLPELKRCIAGSRLKPAQVCVIAFDRALLLKSKSLLPDVEHGRIVDWPSRTGFSRLLERAVADGLDALDFSARWRLTAQRVARAHDAGLRVYVWTVDAAAKARQLARAGVDGITTNAPARIRQALG